jgi:hypothetical protein
LPRRFGFAGLEPGDRRGGGAGDLDEQLPGVVDAEADVGLFDGDGWPAFPIPTWMRCRAVLMLPGC